MLDHRKLTPQEAFIFLNFNIVSHAHIKTHSAANWGVNPRSADPFLRWISVVTVLYNYFGATTFTQVTDFWMKIGILRYDFSVLQVFIQLGCDEGPTFRIAYGWTTTTASSGSWRRLYRRQQQGSVATCRFFHSTVASATLLTPSTRLSTTTPTRSILGLPTVWMFASSSEGARYAAACTVYYYSMGGSQDLPPRM